LDKSRSSGEGALAALVASLRRNRNARRRDEARGVIDTPAQFAICRKLRRARGEPFEHGADLVEGHRATYRRFARQAKRKRSPIPPYSLSAPDCLSLPDPYEREETS
jgi:hypothetical protein